MKNLLLAKHQRAMDSTLSYFINQLDNFDPKLHEPLFSVSWGRDIKLRGNVSLANESTSFTRSTFGAAGTLSAKLAQGPAKPWISGNSSAIQGISVNGERIVTPLRPLARQIDYTSIELQRSQLLGQPIDTQKTVALQSQYQLETDAMVYIGDTDVSAEGLLNSSLVTAASVATGIGGLKTWASKTPDEILADVNTLINAAWAATGYAICPSGLRVPPVQFSLLAAQKVSSAGNISVLEFLKKNSIALSINGKELDIQPIKWLVGAGVAAADRMMCYTNDSELVRFPMVPIRRETAYYQGISFIAPYVYGFGEVEFVRPETVRYADGI